MPARLGVLMSTVETIQRIQTIRHISIKCIYAKYLRLMFTRHREETSRFLTMQRQLAGQLKQIFDTHVTR